ncbi:MAG: sulfur carrier protein ThiS [Acidobacteriota bacterium]|jgi:thiamine biosynthesis protein ThiS
MKLILNGESVDVKEQCSLTELLELVALPSDRIAIELNKCVVRKRSWEETTLKDGDRIEVVHFVGGG